MRIPLNNNLQFSFYSQDICSIQAMKIMKAIHVSVRFETLSKSTENAVLVFIPKHGERQGVRDKIRTLIHNRLIVKIILIKLRLTGSVSCNFSESSAISHCSSTTLTRLLTFRGFRFFAISKSNRNIAPANKLSANTRVFFRPPGSKLGTTFTSSSTSPLMHIETFRDFEKPRTLI